MKKYIIYTFLLVAVFSIAACEKDIVGKGKISPYIPIYDLKNLHKGEDVTLDMDNMFGSDHISGIVVSDHSGGNLPEGLLMIQDKKRLSQLRGIAIPIGADATKYVRGDSVKIAIVGGVLKRVDGMLQITNVPASAITKLGSNMPIEPNRVPSSNILADPFKYESTEVVIVKGGFDPLPQPSDVLNGDKILSDGFANLTLHTAPTSKLAGKNNLPVLGNFYGVVVLRNNADGKIAVQHRVRKDDDIVYLSSVIEISPIIITGFINDPQGTDNNNEYMQFMATRDINFSETPFAVVTNNNAGATVPQGNPANGWATGGGKTYKFNLTTGTAKKGTFFYVGGTNRRINSSNSTLITEANWIKTRNYGTTAGEGFGTATTNLLANSGNAFGIAVFAGTTVTKESKPIDVVFVSAGGSLFDAATNVGYRIANNDFYDVVNPITIESQPFYRQGSNTLNFIYTTPADQGFFYKLGGEYNTSLGRWAKVRTQTNLKLEKNSTLDAIEGISIRVGYDGTGKEISRDTIPPTILR
ncbi:DUF5689 domain-containing protein [Pedobacter namyangjuensis]|uniref:DUF5689 domain-containing protein n=1 Tax=Pedobacter namyangjuensis TaxID=600626 RepID=UPI000DE483E9|nr:DUF5689 domain-containing protein [Pedobacter namyangjuensis]